MLAGGFAMLAEALDYAALKEATLDPYVMIRNEYVQNRNKLIAE